MITLGLVDSVDDNGVYVTMPGSRGVLRGPYKSLATVAAGTTVLVASTDDGEQVVVGPVNGEDGTINVRTFGAKGDGVTDDTEAIRDAIAYACSLSKYLVGESGWRSFVPTVYFPTGRYVVSEKGALNCVGSGLAGYNLAGNGYLNTEILYTYEPVGDESNTFLLTNGGDDYFGFSYISDLSIRGNGSNKFWRVTSQNGAPQACRFRRVFMTNLVECVTVEYGSADANADLFRFESCKASAISGWVFGVKDVTVSQSVVHSFHDCDFESISGKILYFRSGGTAEIRGGSWIMTKTGRAIHLEDATGSGIGTSNKYFAFYGTKFEWQHGDEDDTELTYAPLFYNKSVGKIAFENCNFAQFTDAGHQYTTYDHGHIDKRGSVVFRGCYLPEIVTFKTTVDGGDVGTSTPRLIFDGCELTSQVYDMVNVTFASNSGATGSSPNVIADGCIAAPNVPVDVTLFKDLGWRTVTPKRHIYQFKTSTYPDFGLPCRPDSGTTEQVNTYEVPREAIITKVRVVFNGTGDGGTYTVAVKDYTGSTTLVSATHSPSAGDYVEESAALYYRVDTEAKRELQVVGTGTVNSDGSISGFIEVEYH